LNFVENNIKKTLLLRECSIEKAYNMIYHDVFNLNNAANGIDIYSEFVIENGETISELINEY